MLTKTQINDLFKIQKVCIRIALKKSARVNCMELLQTNKLLSFQELIDLESIKYGYKINNSLVPEPIKKIMHHNGGLKTHSYNTRNKTTLNIQKHQCSMRENTGSELYPCDHILYPCDRIICSTSVLQYAITLLKLATVL